jgi:hypothetical protein
MAFKARRGAITQNLQNSSRQTWMARREIADLLKVAAALDGGKTTFTTIGLIVALSIGGVGIAAMGEPSEFQPPRSHF